jgi:hypothetical protein
MGINQNNMRKNKFSVTEIRNNFTKEVIKTDFELVLNWPIVFLQYGKGELKRFGYRMLRKLKSRNNYEPTSNGKEL